MYPILFRVGSRIIYTYTILLYVGTVAGLFVAMRAGQQHGHKRVTVLEAALCAMAGSLLLGRVVYMLPHLSQYVAQPEMIGNWGNQTFHGALLGGLIGLALYARWRRVAFWPLLDVITPGLLIVQFCGWLGLLLHGGNYGATTYAGWAWELPDIYGVVTPRIPTQLLGIMATIVLMVLVKWVYRKQQPPGVMFAQYAAANALLFFAIEFTRAPASLNVGPLRPSQWLYIAEFLLALWWLGQRLRQRHSASPVAPKS